jgi:hypothetical protein
MATSLRRRSVTSNTDEYISNKLITIEIPANMNISFLVVFSHRTCRYRFDIVRLQIHKQRCGNEKYTYKQLKSAQNIPCIRFRK